MLSGREAELAGRLREAAASGQTSVVLKLLEEGAPFVVDSVSIMSTTPTTTAALMMMTILGSE